MVQLSSSSQNPRESPPTSDYARVARQERDYQPPAFQRPSYVSDGAELPWPSDKSDGTRMPPYSSGGNKLPWISHNPVQIQPGTSVRTKPGAGPLAQAPTNQELKSGGATGRPSYPSGGTKLPWISHNPVNIQPGTSVRTKPGVGPPSSSKPPSEQKGYLTQAPTKQGLSWDKSGVTRRPPYASGGTELPWISHNRVGVQPGTSVRTKPGTSKVPPSEPLPQSKSFWNGLAGNYKSWLKPLTNVKVWRRISPTARRNRGIRFAEKCSFLPF